MKPIIAIATSMVPREITEVKRSPFVYVPYDYIETVSANGGVPLLLPISSDFSHIDTYLDQIDGLILAGGYDISPELYGETPLPELQETLRIRDDFEYLLTQKAMAKHLPILGVCRGLQMLNVANGGTLYQDINTQANPSFNHIQPESIKNGAHDVLIQENSQLYHLVGNSITVNTLHHQAIKDIAPNLRAVAHSTDGFIEAVESTDPNQYMLGVQWHPEMMAPHDDKPSQLIFKSFIETCQYHKKG